jgi:hypothetical protein
LEHGTRSSPLKSALLEKSCGSASVSDFILGSELPNDDLDPGLSSDGLFIGLEPEPGLHDL